MSKTIRLTPTNKDTKRKVVARSNQNGARREQKQRLDLAARVCQRQAPGPERDLELVELT